MSTKIHNFRIGLFVVGSACLVILALFAMGLKSFFGARDMFETYVPGKVENLSVGALVKLRGVTIGKVTSIGFVGSEYPGFGEDAVVVRFAVPRSTPWVTETNNVQAMIDGEVARGLRARVQGQGFLGANIVAIEYVDPELYPVAPIPWKPKHYYIPSAPNQLNSVLNSVEKSLRHVENLDVNDVLGRVEKLVDSANRLVDAINHVDFAGLGTNANSLVSEFRQTNRGLQGTLADAAGAIKEAQGAISSADLPGIRKDTAALEAKLSDAADQLRRLLGTVDVGDLNASLVNVHNATDELISLLHTIEQQPSTVLFSKPPPPVADMEKPPKK